MKFSAFVFMTTFLLAHRLGDRFRTLSFFLEPVPKPLEHGFQLPWRPRAWPPYLKSRGILLGRGVPSVPKISHGSAEQGFGIGYSQYDVPEQHMEREVRYEAV